MFFSIQDYVENLKKLNDNISYKGVRLNDDEFWSDHLRKTTIE